MLHIFIENDNANHNNKQSERHIHSLGGELPTTYKQEQKNLKNEKKKKSRSSLHSIEKRWGKREMEEEERVGGGGGREDRERTSKKITGGFF